MTTRQQVSTYVAVAIVFFAASMIIDRVEWKKPSVKPTPTVTANVTPTNEVVFGPDGLPLPVPEVETTITIPGPSVKTPPLDQLQSMADYYERVCNKSVQPNDDGLLYAIKCRYDKSNGIGMVTYSRQLSTDERGVHTEVLDERYLKYYSNEWHLVSGRFKFFDVKNGYDNWEPMLKGDIWFKVVDHYYDR
jgi:hypothetical protein